MSDSYNVYCDESCHLENDTHPVMVLGAVWCAVAKTREIASRLREIKERHGLPRDFEVKWSRVMAPRLPFYLDYIDYFFDDDDLHFRALIADKTGLRHRDFRQTHDEWYYKMYFAMLKAFLRPKARYSIYLDIKDSNSAAKVEHLRDVLCTNMYDFNRQVVQKMQMVRSHEVEHVQLADMLIGAVSYANRGLQTSTAKTELVRRVKERTGYQLTRSTLLKEEKFNLFRWQPGTVLEQ